MKQRVRGEITVFFALIFLVFLSFINSVLFLVKIQTSKNRAKLSTNQAVNSVFAEYQNDLLEKYGIFALDGTYESGTYSTSNIIRRLEYYGASDIDQELEKIQYLTDDEGAAFYDQAVKSVLESYGISVEDAGNGSISETDTIKENMETAQSQEEYEKQFEADESDAKSTWERALENANSAWDKEDGENAVSSTKVLSDAEEENPFRTLQMWKSESMLTLVVPKDTELSGLSVELSGLVSKRTRNEGNGSFDGKVKQGSVYRSVFEQYVEQHFTCFTSKEHSGVLQYEQEYLIGGNASDKENLEAVVKKLVHMRLGANYLYLNTDTARKARAEAAAAALAVVAEFPALQKVITQGILLLWSYAESCADVKTLLEGNRVSLVKTSGEWKTDIPVLTTSGTSSLATSLPSGLSSGESSESGKGLTYQQYLGLILMTTSQDKLNMRSLDLIEENMKHTEEKSFFRADNCVSRIRLYSTANLDRGIQYTFNTEFGYE